MNLDFPQEVIMEAIMDLVEANKFGPAYPSVMYSYDKTEEWIAQLSKLGMKLKLDSSSEEDEMCNAYRIERKLEWECKFDAGWIGTKIINLYFCSRYFPYPPIECFNTIHIEIAEEDRHGERRGRVQVDSTNFESFSSVLEKHIAPKYYGDMYGI